MFDSISDTHSLAEFADHSDEYARQIMQTRSPVVLTVDGKAELVVQDAESYQALLDAVERAETIAGEAGVKMLLPAILVMASTVLI